MLLALTKEKLAIFGSWITINDDLEAKFGSMPTCAREDIIVIGPPPDISVRLPVFDLFQHLSRNIDMGSMHDRPWVTTANASIKAGADVNGLDTRANVAGPNGRRPLNYAAIRNDTAMITTLLNAGANLNLANRSGFTPLHHAGEAGSKEAATLLIAKGANLTLRNMHDQTAEQTARASHHPDVAEILRQPMTSPK